MQLLKKTPEFFFFQEVHTAPPRHFGQVADISHLGQHPSHNFSSEEEYEEEVCVFDYHAQNPLHRYEIRHY